MISKKLFIFIKSKIPKISSTELIALKSWNTSLDRSILEGKIKLPKKSIINQKFPDYKIQKLNKIYDGSIIYPNKNNNKWIDYLAKNKYFSFLIHEDYYNNIIAMTNLKGWILIY